MTKRISPKEAAAELFREMRADFARKGGTARAKALSAQQRSAIAKKAAAARWKKKP